MLRRMIWAVAGRDLINNQDIKGTGGKSWTQNTEEGQGVIENPRTEESRLAIEFRGFSVTGLLRSKYKQSIE